METALPPSQRLKIETIMAYASDPSHPACESCGEDSLVCLTLSHTASPTEAEKREAARIHRPRLSGATLRGWLKRQGFPRDPEIASITVECMNCNLKRAGWGNGGWGSDGTGRRKRRRPSS
jgi:hypothetical protein